MIRSKFQKAESSWQRFFGDSWAGEHLFHFRSKTAAPIYYYKGKWSFTDEATGRTHQLEITDRLQILIDGRQLPGKIEKVDHKELLFLDKYGYHLRIDANGGHPVSLYDEADNQVYPITKIALQ